ncbi:MAG: glucuronate isomerase [Clostridia bacterium]|nr:glucuronate isomerase [Clostridia bacterium]
MMSFINDDFMLKNKTGKRLFEEYAKDLPIIDYHCHLVPKMIAENYKFKSTYDLFLGGDHYKWRQMRSNGVPEEDITGSTPDYEKWLQWARTMPLLIGNPLYHWTHLELKRYFDIDKPFTEETAKEIWDKCNKLLARDDFSAQELIKKSNVEVICTTDDPVDSLEYHQQLKGFSTKILPTFRPDKIVEINKETFLPYLETANVKTFEDVLHFLTERIEFFHSVGCRLSDHALEYVPFGIGDAKAVFEKKVNGGVVTYEEENIYKTAVLKHCASEYVKRDWTMQLHIGALRNNNRKMYEKLGPDTGFDSINDLCIAEKLSAFLGNLEYDYVLPKTILYTLNPKDNFVIGTMLGNFQKAPTAGKIQFGSGWWFNDHRDGMEAQMMALANLGVLGRFVGMLTDSRSFVSYTRHEYFRRILCNMIGKWVEEGEYPNDKASLKRIIEGISYYNAKEYFKF